MTYNLGISFFNNLKTFVDDTESGEMRIRKTGEVHLIEENQGVIAQFFHHLDFQYLEDRDAFLLLDEILHQLTEGSTKEQDTAVQGIARKILKGAKQLLQEEESKQVLRHRVYQAMLRVSKSHGWHETQTMKKFRSDQIGKRVKEGILGSGREIEVETKEAWSEQVDENDLGALFDKFPIGTDLPRSVRYLAIVGKKSWGKEGEKRESATSEDVKEALLTLAENLGEEQKPEAVAEDRNLMNDKELQTFLKNEVGFQSKTFRLLKACVQTMQGTLTTCIHSAIQKQLIHSENYKISISPQGLTVRFEERKIVVMHTLQVTADPVEKEHRSLDRQLSFFVDLSLELDPDVTMCKKVGIALSKPIVGESFGQ